MLSATCQSTENRELGQVNVGSLLNGAGPIKQNKQNDQKEKQQNCSFPKRLRNCTGKLLIEKKNEKVLPPKQASYSNGSITHTHNVTTHTHTHTHTHPFDRTKKEITRNYRSIEKLAERQIMFHFSLL